MPRSRTSRRACALAPSPSGASPILKSVQRPGSPPEGAEAPGARPSLRPDRVTPRPGGIWGLGERVAWIAGLVLAVSAFTGWYAGPGEDLNLSVIGWHTGTLGKLVFVSGLVLLAIAALRQAGIELPATVPESLVVITVGSLATVFVLVRLISIPDRFLPAADRGIGLWISLAAALAVIVAGLLQATDEA